MSINPPWLQSLPPTLNELCLEWQKSQPLKKENLDRLWQRLRLEWSYNSNHIEGNTLTYGETLLLLIHGRTKGNHLLREYDEMKGHDIAIEYLRSLAKEERFLAEADIRDLNRMILKEGFWRVAETAEGEPTRKWIEPGQYKTKPNHVLTATGEIFYFTSPESTPAEMRDLSLWLQRRWENQEGDFLEFLAEVHQKFIRIHPFDDGNGRVVRLLLNYFLIKLELVPLIIATKERTRYLTCLAQGDAGDMQPLREFLAEGLDRSLRLGIQGGRELLPLEREA